MAYNLKSKPIILKELCRACGIRQSHIGEAIGMSRSAINLACNRRYIPVAQPDFKPNVEAIIRNNSRAMTWLRERGYNLSDIWRTEPRQSRAVRREYTGIAGRLREARQKLGLTQREMAALLGVAAPSWQGYELGRSIPGALVIVGLVDLGFNANWLLSGAGGMTLTFKG